MLLPLKPVCKKSMQRRDGTSIVFIQYCYSAEKRTLLDSEIAIPAQYWNTKKRKISSDLPSTYGDAALLNDQLRNSIRLAEDILSFALTKKMADPLTFLKKTFKPDFDPSSLEDKLKAIEKPRPNLDVFFQLDDYIRSKTRQVTPPMLKVFKSLRNTLFAYQQYSKKPITFESFDFNFYEDFVEYMMYEHIHRRRKTVIRGFRISTIGRTIKQLRIFLRNRMRKKIIAPINLEDFKIMDEESDAIYLTNEEVYKIYTTDLSGYPHLSKYRDLFVFGCLTGLRFSDYTNINPEDVRNGMLYKKQDKSDKWVAIPLRDEASEIYFKRFKRKIPCVRNSVFNRFIKEVAQIAGIIQPIRFSYKKGNKDVITIKPKYGWITSHTCRRSFCTNEFLAGTPVELIMRISGHKSLRDFYRYIRISHEEAGQKIKEIWQGRGDMRLSDKIEDSSVSLQLTQK